MKRKKTFPFILLWLGYLFIPFFGLEGFVKQYRGYNLFPLHLTSNAYHEADKMKIWNKKFVEERRKIIPDFFIPNQHTIPILALQAHIASVAK